MSLKEKGVLWAYNEKDLDKAVKANKANGWTCSGPVKQFPKDACGPGTHCQFIERSTASTTPTSKL